MLTDTASFTVLAYKTNGFLRTDSTLLNLDEFNPIVKFLTLVKKTNSKWAVFKYAFIIPSF